MSAPLRRVEGGDGARSTRPALRSAPIATWAQIAVLAILAVVALRYGSSLLIPIAISVLLSLLAGPPIRWMTRQGVPGWLGATLIVGGGVGLLGGGAYLLSRPATEWLAHAPETLPQVEAKLRLLALPFRKMERTAEQVTQAASSASAGAPSKVTVAAPSWMMRVGGGTASLTAALITIVFLTYFLSSTGPLFTRKLVGLMPDREHQGRIVRAVAEIEAQTSSYLYLTSLISLGLGVATWLLLFAFGLRNAVLWGAVAGILNFIPYVGTLVSAVLIGGAGLVAFDGVERTLLMLGSYFVIHTVSGNLITPAVLGRKLPLNRVALFICLVFWAWTWGVAGAIMAVPLTVMFKVICDQIERMRPLAVLLDS